MHDPAIAIRIATLEDGTALTRLYIVYRVFYGEPPAEEAAQRFIRDRLSNDGSVYFLAWSGDPLHSPPSAFMHLMPSTNTLAMRPIWLLEDLYVDPSSRNRGIATALLRRAESFARSTGAERLTLATAHNNTVAQSIYQKLGYAREEHFQYFHRVLS